MITVKYSQLHQIARNQILGGKLTRTAHPIGTAFRLKHMVDAINKAHAQVVSEYNEVLGKEQKAISDKYEPEFKKHQEAKTEVPKELSDAYDAEEEAFGKKNIAFSAQTIEVDCKPLKMTDLKSEFTVEELGMLAPFLLDEHGKPMLEIPKESTTSSASQAAG